MKGFIIRTGELKKRLMSLCTVVIHQHRLHHFSAHVAAGAAALKNYHLYASVMCRLQANMLACFHLLLLLLLMSRVAGGTMGSFVPVCVRCDEPRALGRTPLHCTLLSFPLLEPRGFLFWIYRWFVNNSRAHFCQPLGNFPFGVSNTVQMDFLLSEVESFCSCYKSTMRPEDEARYEVYLGFLLNGNFYFQLERECSSRLLERLEPCVQYKPKQAGTVYMKGKNLISPVFEIVIASIAYSTQKHCLDTHRETDKTFL